MLGPYPNEYSYLWSNNSQNPYFEVSGNDLETGIHPISVLVTDLNTCQNADTIIVTVLPLTGIEAPHSNHMFQIFPNPAKEFINIDVSDLVDNDITIKLFNQQGIEMFNKKFYIEHTSKVIQIDITSIPKGVYYLQVISSNMLYTGKVVSQ
jgi:hypothetical protein